MYWQNKHFAFSNKYTYVLIVFWEIGRDARDPSKDSLPINLFVSCPP